MTSKKVGIAFISLSSVAAFGGLITYNSVMSLLFSTTILDSMILVALIFGFLYFLSRKPRAAVLLYIKYILFFFSVYSSLLLFGLWAATLPETVYLFNQAVVIDVPGILIKIVISGFCFLYFCLLFLDFSHNNIKSIELPLLVSLLFWVFLFSVTCYNMLVFFLLMEIITLLVVSSNALYFIFVGQKLVKPLAQFFILNILISTFFLLGLVMFCFQAPVVSHFNASYTMWWYCYEHITEALTDRLVFFSYFKFLISFLLIPIIFKITLAPFSIWIVHVYSNLPILLLLLMMTVYKFVYLALFIRLILNVVDVLPLFRHIWQFSLFFFFIPSFFVGFLAYRTQDLKTILAFTTVSQLGYVTAGLFVATPAAITFAVLYFCVYCLQLMSMVSVFILLQRKYSFSNLNQLFLVSKYSPGMSWLLFINFFSLAGIPPLSGFFTKYFLFLSIYIEGYFVIAFFGLVSGVLMAILYLQMALQLMTQKVGQDFILRYELAKKASFVRLTQLRGYYIFTKCVLLFIVFVGILNVGFFIFLPKGLSYVSMLTVPYVYANSGGIVPEHTVKVAWTVVDQYFLSVHDWFIYYGGLQTRTEWRIIAVFFGFEHINSEFWRWAHETSIAQSVLFIKTGALIPNTSPEEFAIGYLQIVEAPYITGHQFFKEGTFATGPLSMGAVFDSYIKLIWPIITEHTAIRHIISHEIGYVTPHMDYLIPVNLTIFSLLENPEIYFAFDPIRDFEDLH